MIQRVVGKNIKQYKVIQQKEPVISGFSSHYFKLPEYQSWEA